MLRYHINICMTIKDDDQAMQPLYDMLPKEQYVITKSWTTSKGFVDSYSDKKTREFILSELPQIGGTAGTRTRNWRIKSPL
jgi:hypothetical protein